MEIQVADSLLGTLVDGRYRIRGRVARGGMATVYMGVDERLERTVALKIINPAQVREARFVERFTDEAKTIALLTHPNVVAVYDQGTHGGLPYLVMEYVRGRTLRDVLAERGRLNPGEALAILEQMLAAIAAAHRAGLVHRDVKPENVLVAEAPSGGSGNLVDSVVKVADFGLARAVEASADDEAGGQLMATVAYVAPELVTNGHADARTDVYSAGIVLFEMLTGRVPYDGDKPVEVAWQHVDRDVPPPSSLAHNLPEALDDLVARATRRDPGARPTDAGALLAEVQQVRDDLGNSANASTAVLRQIGSGGRAATRDDSQHTQVIAPVSPVDRPSWARLPEQKPQQQPRRRRAAPEPDEGIGGQLGNLRLRLLGDPRARLAFVAGAAVLLLLAVIGIWWAGFGRYTVAPQLVSMTKAEAEAQAAGGGFEVRYATGRYDEQVAKDVVLAQDPPSTSRIVKGGTLTLTLSLGPERYEVPDVVGKDLAQAKADVEGAKLVLKEGPAKFDDRLPKGIVMSADPKPGTQVKSGTTVTVTVSKGRAPITVPEVVGKNINDARAQLQALGLVVVEQYKDDNRAKDEVIAQTPASGSGVEQGAEIKLEVSKGPPQVIVSRVVDLPCQQGKQQLEAQGLAVRVDFNPDGIVRIQNPPENTPVAPGTEVVIGCF
ncbi:Stk1 family PASTA domain-containing Ser/Thr kinase [Phytohabitans suffuscus]